MKKLIIIITLIFGLNLYAQNDDVQLILTKYKNYRFGSINLYEINRPTEIRDYLKKKNDAESGGPDVSNCEAEYAKVDPSVLNSIDKQAANGKSKSQVKRGLAMDGLPIPENFDPVYDCVAAKYTSSGPRTKVKAYIVTLPPEEIGAMPNEIVGLVVVEKPTVSTVAKENLESVPVDYTYSYNKLKTTRLDEYVKDSPYGTMLDLVISYFEQGNVTNKTLEMKGLANDDTWLPEKVGVAKPLINYGNANATISDYDIQKFKRISAGQPEYFWNDQVLSLGLDNISWYLYNEYYQYDDDGNILRDSITNKKVKVNRPSNFDLPRFGIEAKYGIESVNIPSFYSERLTVSAVWDNIKFGFILPTSGWANLQKDLYNQDRAFTYGGFGVAGDMDFALPIIQRSDVFHLDFGYVFSDAEQADHVVDRTGIAYQNVVDPNNPISQAVFNENAEANTNFLIRANATLHYTIGMQIDDNYLIRFGIGGSVMNVESWRNRLDSTGVGDEVEVTFNNINSETVGSLSGRLDFMYSPYPKSKNALYGATINYFDQSFYTNAFIQFSVIERSLLVKVNAMGRFDIKTDEERKPWEIGNFFQPSAQIIYQF